jgi:hypothetical protein
MAAAGRITVGLSKGGGHRHAPGADSHVDSLGPKRRQKVLQTRLTHPVAQVERIAAPNQQGVSLLSVWSWRAPDMCFISMI